MLGVKFVFQARAGVHGIDCIGLLEHVGKSVECSLQDVTSYREIGNLSQLETNLATQLIQTDQIVKGVWLALRMGRNGGHLALYTGDSIIHTYDLIGRVVEHPLDEKWCKRINSVWILQNPKSTPKTDTLNPGNSTLAGHSEQGGGSTHSYIIKLLLNIKKAIVSSIESKYYRSALCISDCSVLFRVTCQCSVTRVQGVSLEYSR